ncbi:MAG: methionyl-tRNA formyltransferase [Pseudomonadales bacterium]
MKILFAGTPEFAARHLEAILQSGHEVCGVVTQPDKPGKRGRENVASAVKKLALQRDLDILQPERLQARHLADFNPELMVVVAYGQLLSREVLHAPPLGCINVHASLLPRWRGAAPIQHAVLAGDDVTGVTIMQMDEGLDTGDILASRQVPVDPDDTSGSLTEKLTTIGPAALLEVISGIAEKTIKPVPQSDVGATYAGKITKADARLNWHRPAAELARAVRALNPDPVAWTLLEDLRVKVWFARPVSDTRNSPGSIVDLSKEGVTVSCGEDALLLTRLQLPLGKGSILSGADMVNARKDLMAPGKRFT